jgi:hypothetical protein
MSGQRSFRGDHGNFVARQAHGIQITSNAELSCAN